jgi:hypothetical protein
VSLILEKGGPILTRPFARLFHMYLMSKDLQVFQIEENIIFNSTLGDLD